MRVALALPLLVGMVASSCAFSYQTRGAVAMQADGKQGRREAAMPSLFGVASLRSSLSGLRQRMPLTLSRGHALAAVASPSTSTDAGAAGAATPSAQERLKIGGYFLLWYAFNIGYNVYNKKALNAVALPWTIATLQLIIGLVYVLPLWLLGVRKVPQIAQGGTKQLAPIALMHMLTHICAVISLGAGAVSFTHIVKASEPLFSAALSAGLLGQYFPFPVYLSLLPVVFGVALASMKELSFTWLGFGAAMGSNTASALRGIFAKKSMGKPAGENLDAPNLYAVLTIMAIVMILPLTAVIEGPTISTVWKAAIAAGVSPKTVTIHTLLSGLYYYLYNEVAFMALDSVHPITHAVGNTIKRVVVIVAAVLIFKTPMTAQGVLGSTIAILGVLLYSLAKDYFKK